MKTPSSTISYISRAFGVTPLLVVLALATGTGTSGWRSITSIAEIHHPRPQ
jgi:hypothetical protein